MNRPAPSEEQVPTLPPDIQDAVDRLARLLPESRLTSAVITMLIRVIHELLPDETREQKDR